MFEANYMYMSVTMKITSQRNKINTSTYTDVKDVDKDIELVHGDTGVKKRNKAYFSSVVGQQWYENKKYVRKILLMKAW